MPVELGCLAFAVVLGFVHIFAAAQAKTSQYGIKWNMGARDEELPPARPLVGRLMRAQANYFETFPLFVAAVLIVFATSQTNSITALGAQTYLAARVIYLPLYAYGIAKLRSLAFIASVIGIAMVLSPAFLN